MSDDVYENFLKRMKSEIETIENYILKGKCVDHPEYLARISEKHAYQRARDNFTRSIQDYENDDKDQPSENDNTSEKDDE